MKIQIKSTNITLTESLKNYIEEKINSCERFIQKIDFPLESYIEIEKTTKHHRKGNIFRAEINLVLPRKLLRCEAKREDIYLAINEAKDKLQREIKEYKNK
jgi:ribosomal subunit interface protein